MKIISPSASFIQFGDLPVRPHLKQMDFALQEYDRFNVAFQFALRNDDDSYITTAGNAAFYIAVATAECAFIERLVKAIPLCYRTTVDTFGSTIHLTEITYGDITNNYDQDVTNAELVEILLNDFGITLIADGSTYYLHECCVTNFQIIYTVDSVETELTIERFFDRFFALTDTAMASLVAINQCYCYAITTNDGSSLSTLAENFDGNTSSSAYAFTLKGVPVVGDVVTVQFSYNPNDIDPPASHTVTSTFIDGWTLQDMIDDLYDKIIAINPNTFAYTDGGGFHGVRTVGFSTASGSTTLDLVENENVIIGCSNLFKRSADGAFLTKIKYRSTEDAFDFQYNESDTICNIITLPVYAARTQFPKKRSVYRKSNGENVLLSAVLDKQPELLTDWMPEFFHECLNIALSHDFFYTKEASNYVQYVCDDEYKVEWANDFTDQGQGNTKLKRQLYNYRNDNCTLANDCCLPPYYTFVYDEEAGTITFSIYTSIRTNLLQLRYREGDTEEWSYADDITDINIPITTFVFDVSELGYGFIEFQWRQKCGANFSNWTPVQNVGGPECTEISSTAIADGPEGTLGVPYQYDLEFFGTPPFTLDFPTKPSWATVSIIEGTGDGPHTLRVSGTPDAGGADLDIIGTISNDCTTNFPVDFCITINDDVVFLDPSDIEEDADNKAENVNLSGPAGAEVTIELTTFSNTNGGTLKVNGSPIFEGNTFTVTLDGTGAGSFALLYEGDSGNTGTSFLALFTITATDLGAIGASPDDTFQTSKAYL